MDQDLQAIRQRYPQYADMSDEQFAQALHSKFYSDMLFAEFAQRVGFQQAPAQQPRRPIRSERDIPPKPFMGGVSDFLRVLADVPLLGFTDELVGAVAGPEAGQRSRERVQALRRDAPGASLLATLAGAAVPGPALAKGVVKAGQPLVSAARGMLAGGALGAAAGVGEAQGSLVERAPQAVGPAALGVMLGGLTAGAGGMMGRAPSLNQRVAGAMERNTGMSARINPAIDAAEASIQRVSDDLYKPLEGAYRSVDDQALRSMLSSERFAPEVRRVSAGVAEGTDAPSFTQLQELRNRLRRKLSSAKRRDLVDEADQFGEMLTDLDTQMQSLIPELRPADQAYYEAWRVRDALDSGRKFYKANADDIARELRGLSPDAQAAFRQGQVAEVMHRLGQGDEQSVAILRTYMDAGPELQRTLRTMFPDDASFGQFMGVLRNERNTRKAATALKRMAVGFGLLGGGYFGFERLTR